MEAKEKQELSAIELILTLATIISAIAFLAKIFGKSDEQKQVDRSREKTYDEGLTYQDFQYSDMANALEVALAESSYEDENAVYAIFRKLKTIGDINKVIQFYDTRRTWLSLQWITLPQTIQKLFNASEKKKLNGIMSANGINYTFE